VLKQLVLNKRKKQKQAELAELETQRTKLKVRSDQLEAAIEEAKTEEEISAVTTEVEQIEAETKELAATKSKLEGEISAIEQEIAGHESKGPALAPAPGEINEKKVGGESRMSTRAKLFRELPMEERSGLIGREEVKQFLVRTRELIGEKRAVSGAELTIPEVLLELLRDNLHRYSKLYNYIRVRTVKGKARQNIMGAIPEAVWTEACGKLNELAFVFSQVEVDGYKVGGFIPICNATVEDSDENLAAEILDAIGQGLGLGVDKAVLYGTGAKMPVGVATRLAQATKPSDWNDKGPVWVDLRASNLLRINPANMTAEAFFAALVLALGVADNKYATGNTFWAMNRKTRMSLMAKMITFNAAGALVAGSTNTMPVEGGNIIELDFIPDNDIVGGFGSLYLLAERSGAQLATSEHVRFIEDQTVFKGTARYDGMPVLGSAFVVVNIANTNPTTSVLFPQDMANTVATPRALPIAGTYTGAQSVALTCDTPEATIYFTTDGSTPTKNKPRYNGPIAVAASATIRAIALKDGMTDSAILSAAYVIS